MRKVKWESGEMNSSVGDLHPLHLKAAAKSWAKDDNKHAPSINKVKWRSQVVQNVNQPVFIKISATSQCKPKNHTNPKQRVLHLTKWLVVSVQKYAKSLHFESFITSHFINRPTHSAVLAKFRTRSADFLKALSSFRWMPTGEDVKFFTACAG